MTSRLAFALDAVHRAGRLTLGYFQTGAEVEWKADDTPVTRADRGAERLLRESIAYAYPGEAILGEEEGGSDAAVRWVIDPIDGTKSFIAGVPLYATLLAYEQGGVPQLGVCAFPALGEVFYAERGGGAYLNGRPCRLRENSDLSRAILCCGAPGTLVRAGRMDAVLRLAAQAAAVRTWSDAYGHMLVAAGRADAMIDPVVARWDVSAIQVIVEEAGGHYSTLDGEPTLGDSALSATPQLADTLLAILRGAP